MGCDLATEPSGGHGNNGEAHALNLITGCTRVDFFCQPCCAVSRECVTSSHRVAIAEQKANEKWLGFKRL